MSIQLLPPDVSSKIAAGEVVERPASVVKELVENSLDAGASEVSIEVRQGGIEYIRVADNGAGIAADQVELAFQRFATSKLSRVLDLDSIATLGFRGEALPSIAAVAHVSLVTRVASEEVGTRIEVSDGRTLSRGGEGAPPGTAVVVRHLFKSLPARRKFLRTNATEASRIQSLATRYALAHPRVRFQMTLDGSPVFSSSGSGDLREAVSDIYGPKVGRAMLELRPERTGGQADIPIVSGMIGSPSVARANRNHTSIFVNGRWVQNRMLGHALQEAYRGFLMERRYPVAVVDIAVPYGEVDVNVHPSKTEVRFRHEGLAFSALQQAVRHTLTTHLPVPGLGSPSVSAYPRGAQTGGASRGPHATSGASVNYPASAPRPESPGPHWPAGEHQPNWAVEPLVPRQALPALRPLGQVQSTYIAAEGPDGVYLIDQHAAHERVLFEQLKADAQSPQVQSLLEAVTVELDPRQTEVLASHMDVISAQGFLVEGFGVRTFIVRGVPSALSDGDPGQSLVEVLDLMAEGGGFESWADRAAYSVACHGAIRAGKTLSAEEMSALTRQLELCQQPHTCPHGRPTMIHMSSSRLEREFGRR
jgi:DNA mismatch repair protein MutL